MQIDHNHAVTPPAAPWGRPGDILEGLSGSWSLARVIAGREADQGSPRGPVPLGNMRGTATFRRLESGLFAYREEGRLQLPGGGAFDSFRDYLYDRRFDGFAVLFPETPPRLFHQVVLHRDAAGALVGDAEHLCALDLYATRYAFQPDGRFSIHHDVRGPRKDYAMITVYTRSLPLPRS